jgi:hypothetical protein
VGQHPVEQPGASRPVNWVPLALSAAIDLAAVALVALGNGRPSSYLMGGAVHLVALSAVLYFDDDLVGCRRALAAALVLALPLSGIMLAALALMTRQRSGLMAAIVPELVETPTPNQAGFRKIAASLSPCEVLSVSGHEDSSATLAALTRRGNAESVQLLRWLILASPNLAVEAALALEELSMRFDAGLDQRRAALAQQPSADAALEQGRFIATAMSSGLVDPVMLAARAAEARRCFALARALDPKRAPEVTLAWARLELAALRPEAALRLADYALAFACDPAISDALAELRAEARFASRRPAQQQRRPTLLRVNALDTRVRLVA